MNKLFLTNKERELSTLNQRIKSRHKNKGRIRAVLAGLVLVAVIVGVM